LPSAGSGEIEAVEVTRCRDGQVLASATTAAGGTPPPPANWLASRLGGADPTPLDLLIPRLPWLPAQTIRRERLRGRPCYVLEVSPPSHLKPDFACLMLWVDEVYRGVLQAEACDSSGNVLRRLLVDAVSTKARSVTKFRVLCPSTQTKTRVIRAQQEPGTGGSDRE
jgi:hypothetical protein